MIEAMKVRKELWSNAVKGSEQWEQAVKYSKLYLQS